MKNGLILLILLLVEVIVFTSIDRSMFPPRDGLFAYYLAFGRDVLIQASPILTMAFGMTLVLATAGIDLSVGSMVALVGCAMSLLPGDASFWWLALPVGLGVAVFAGAANGLLIALFDIPPIIATLGTLILYRGLCFVLIERNEMAPFADVPGYSFLGSFVVVVCFLAALYIGGGYFLRRSRWLRELLMFGGNPVAARYAGVRISRRIVETYAFVGLLAFFAALIFTSRNVAISASSLEGFELKVIVAVVLGGTRVDGGVARFFGSFLGVLVIAVMEEGLRAVKLWGDQSLPFEISHLRYLILGALLVFGVWMNRSSKA